MNNEITLKNKKEIIASKKNLAHLFNSYYINITEISSGINPKTISSICSINCTDEI